jgi:hypothetical protein
MQKQKQERRTSAPHEQENQRRNKPNQTDEPRQRRTEALSFVAKAPFGRFQVFFSFSFARPLWFVAEQGSGELSYRLPRVSTSYLRRYVLFILFLSRGIAVGSVADQKRFTGASPSTYMV